MFTLAQNLEVRLNEAKPVTGGLLFGLAGLPAAAVVTRPHPAKPGAGKKKPGQRKRGKAKAETSTPAPKQKRRR